MDRALKLFFALLGALMGTIFKTIEAHMAQHGHTWHDLCTLMITYGTTSECHDHALHNFCMHITHGTVVALTLHSTSTNDTMHMGTNESPLAMDCILSLPWFQIIPWTSSVVNTLCTMKHTCMRKHKKHERAATITWDPHVAWHDGRSWALYTSTRTLGWSNHGHHANHQANVFTWVCTPES